MSVVQPKQPDPAANPNPGNNAANIPGSSPGTKFVEKPEDHPEHAAANEAPARETTQQVKEPAVAPETTQRGNRHG